MACLEAMAHFITETTLQITAPSLEEWGRGWGRKGKREEGGVWQGMEGVRRENVSK